MKTIFFARHAKSDWNQPGYSDFERPLNNKGEKDAPAMAAYLKKNKFSIEKIISSDAVRALATATEYKKALTAGKNIITEHSLYNASLLEIENIVKTISPQFSSVMLVGHNPGMSEIVNYYAFNSIDDMPACGVVKIDFDVAEWAAIETAAGDFQFFKYPKNI